MDTLLEIPAVVAALRVHELLEPKQLAALTEQRLPELRTVFLKSKPPGVWK